MTTASQYIRGAAAAADLTTLSGIALVTTATAVPNPQIAESVAVDKDKIASPTQTITESVEVKVI